MSFVSLDHTQVGSRKNSVISAITQITEITSEVPAPDYSSVLPTSSLPYITSSSSIVPIFPPSSSTPQTNLENITIYNAGGGSGSENLTFKNLSDQQTNLFLKTLNINSGMEKKNLQQEKRQLIIFENKVSIRIKIYREDFPLVNDYFVIEYYKSTAQDQWSRLMSDISKKFQINFIYALLSRQDKIPIYRILLLKDGGEYIVRIRETASIVEVLQFSVGSNIKNKETEELPFISSFPSLSIQGDDNTSIVNAKLKPSFQNINNNDAWPIVQDILNAKKELIYSNKGLQAMNSQLKTIINKPTTTIKERDIAHAILESKKPDEIIVYLCKLYVDPWDNLMLNNDKKKKKKKKKNELLFYPDPITWLRNGNESKLISILSLIQFNNFTLFNNKIDAINLHRLALECLNRMSTKKELKDKFLSQSSLYILKILTDLKDEIDIVVIGLQLISKTISLFTTFRESLFHAVLDIIQFYSPPKPIHRASNKPYRLSKKKEGSSKNFNNFGVEFVHDLENDDKNFIDPSELLEREKAIYPDQTIKMDRLYPKKNKNDLKDVEEFAPLQSYMFQFTRYTSNHVLEKDRAEFRRLKKVIEKNARLIYGDYEDDYNREIAREIDGIINEEFDKTSHKRSRSNSISSIFRIRRRTVSFGDENAAITNKTTDDENDEIGNSAEENDEENELDNDKKNDTTRKDTLYSIRDKLKEIDGEDDSNSDDDEEDDDEDEDEDENDNQTKVSQSLDGSNPTILKISKRKNTKRSTIFSLSSSNNSRKNVNGMVIVDRNNLGKTLDKSTIGLSKKFRITKGEVSRTATKLEPITFVNQDEIENQQIHLPITLPPLPDISPLKSARKSIHNENLPKSARGNVIGLDITAREGILTQSSDPIVSLDNTLHNKDSSDLADSAASNVIIRNKIQVLIPDGVFTNSTYQKFKGFIRPKPKGFNGKKSIFTHSTSSLINSSNKSRTSFYNNASKSPDLTNNSSSETSLLDSISYEERSLALIQAFATILKIVVSHFGHRDWAFNNDLAGELGEIVINTPSIPTLAEYYVEIIDSIYSEGFSLPLDLIINQIDEISISTPSMQVSSYRSVQSKLLERQKLYSNMEGVAFDAISELSLPTINLDESINGDFYSVSHHSISNQSDLTESVFPVISSNASRRSLGAVNGDNQSKNEGNLLQDFYGGKNAIKNAISDPLLIYFHNSKPGLNSRMLYFIMFREAVKQGKIFPSDVAKLIMDNSTTNKKKENDDDNKDKNSDLGSVISSKRHSIISRTSLISEDYDKMLASPLNVVTQQVTPGLNITTFAWRYLQTPSLSTIQAISYAANHAEVSKKLRETAAYWLSMWDDNTKDYETVIRKGKNLAGF